MLLAVGCGDDDEPGSAADTSRRAESTSSTAEGADATTGTTDAEASEDEGGTTYVGELEGTDAYIGLVVGETGATAYVCDGPQGDESHWFTGAVNDSQVALISPSGASLSGDISGGTVSGTVLIPGDLPEAPDPEAVLAGATSYEFEATEAEGEAGLLRDDLEADDGTPYAGGWVRLADGSVRGDVISVDDDFLAIVPPELLAIFPPNPLSGSKPVKSKTGTRACTIADRPIQPRVEELGRCRQTDVRKDLPDLVRHAVRHGQGVQREPRLSLAGGLALTT